MDSGIAPPLFDWHFYCHSSRTHYLNLAGPIWSWRAFVGSKRPAQEQMQNSHIFMNSLRFAQAFLIAPCLPLRTLCTAHVRTSFPPVQNRPTIANCKHAESS